MRLDVRIILAHVALALCLRGEDAASETVIHSERSLYRNITVYEENGERCMKFSRLYAGNRQSCVLLRDPARLIFAYTKMMLASLYLAPRPTKVLILGLGGGTLPAALIRIFPDIEMDVVEVDAAVIRMARQYFDFHPGARVRVHEQDGRVFVKRAGRTGAKYDLVMLDAFDLDYIPEHMLTREFLQEVREVLTPTGVLAANTFSSSRSYAHESATYTSVFGEFYNLKRTNRIILAKMDGLPSSEVLAKNAKSIEDKLKPAGVDSGWLLSLFSTMRDWPKDARVLTEQYSPSNLLNRQ